MIARTTYICSIAHVASLLGEELRIVEVIISNDDNPTYGNIVSLQTGPETYITALIDEGIEELREMLTAACCATKGR
ncbi:hypothetical protein [Hoeflea prorocentri]|uniref:Uncharacterized protein n=1 Tax=Hoeflea prorocentri TaxID=1922333 RepID=A0A9X3ZG06_9HYPH|nr:hypothetical protein [Hoeflea prorocentri]MCY6380247.1 hypothetical protein [Hoeflea prorocentri]MDA5398047.1 hypothetical protein [Hoeflea prorocentri]